MNHVIMANHMISLIISLTTDKLELILLFASEIYILLLVSLKFSLQFTFHRSLYY